MELRALSWNLFHGRDHPPDPALRTWRSSLLWVTETNATHAQVNRDLFAEFAGLLADADWDVALLQECPPRWSEPLARITRATAHRALTSRNSLAPLRALAASLNPDLIAANEGGSNLTLVRGEIIERRELVLAPGPLPERRVMAFTRAVPVRFDRELCIANLHASAGPRRRARAEREVALAAARALEWSGDAPLVFGGDLNLRPRETAVYEQLAERQRLSAATGPDALDHLLANGLVASAATRAWPAEEREVPAGGGRALRLSDHAPVAATFVAADGRPATAARAT
jgi:endonuclease/exonuclease/phosphatase family metal-dependent hydrolase